MKFYSVAKKAPVEVANSNVTIRIAKNGRYQAVANVNGSKVYRFVNAETAQRLGAPALPASAKRSARKSAKKSIRVRKSTKKARKSTKKARKSTKKARKSTRRSTRRRSTRRA